MELDNRESLYKIECIIESILFATGEPVLVKELCKVLGKDEDTVKSVLNNLCEKYLSEDRGIKIIQLEDSFQMCTNPKYFEYIKDLYGKNSDKKILTQVLLETIAIIAYKQPITKVEIESIRGVNADHAVNTLMKYGLICEKGRLDVPGRPIIFGTTDDFLRYFGFKSLNDMKNIDIIENYEFDIT